MTAYPASPAPDFDIAVIGAGIQGAGVAQAAAARGYSALLLEKKEPAAGTSSRSSKLIHGGLRYLETLQFGLVRESLAEREVLARIAPDLVRWVPFHIPVYGGSRRGAAKVRLGLSLYALLGGMDRHSRFQAVPRSGWDALDGLETRGLRAVFRYWDAATDDAALTRAVVRSAVGFGARVETDTFFLSARPEGTGYRLLRKGPRGEAEVSVRALVNAAGPWIGAVQGRIEKSPAPLPFELVQGAHILLRGQAERGIYYVESPRDGRPVFVMPWKGNILVGTTETPFSGDPDAVVPTPGEIDYLIETFRSHFPARAADLLGSFAGLRVLPSGSGSHARRPREVMLESARPSLVAVYGGKLTGYRRTAEKVMALLAPFLPPPPRRADTSRILLR